MVPSSISEAEDNSLDGVNSLDKLNSSRCAGDNES